LRLEYTTGLDSEQLDELVARVEARLPEPWNKPTGRRRKLSLRDGIAISVAYSRHNTIQEVLAERWGVSQETVSETMSYLTPLIEAATEEFVPTEQDATEAVAGRVCLLDGSLGPCWSWADHDELWTRKHGTTGHNFQVITGLSGDPLFISDPVPGSVHDSVAITMTPVTAILARSGGVIADKGYQGCGYATPRKKPKGGQLSVGDKRENAALSRLRAPVERAMAHIKSWRILHTDYRRPLKTYLTSFRATIGLFFFQASF
jgi:transposase